MMKSIWSKLYSELAKKGIWPFVQKDVPEHSQDGGENSDQPKGGGVKFSTEKALIKALYQDPSTEVEPDDPAGAATGIKLDGLAGDKTLSTEVAMDLGHDCANCGHLVTGEYCNNCGQRDRDLRRPIWVFLYDLFDDFLALDGRLVNTMGPLLFLPGKMTNDFVDGKRARFVPPIRLYLFASIFFFLVVSVTDIALINFEWSERSSAEREKEKEVEKQLRDRGINVNFSEDPEEVKTKEEMNTQEIEARRAELFAEINELKEKMMTSARAVDIQEPVNPDVGASRDRKDRSAKRDKRSMRDLRIQLAKKARELAELEGYERDEQNSDDSWDDIALNSVIVGNENYQLNAGMFVKFDESKKGVVPPPEQFEKYKEWAVDIKAKDDSTENELKFANFGERVVDGFYLASQDPSNLNDALNDWVQRALFLLLPFFALLLRFFYWNKRNMLIRQLVFSLHFHTYIFLVLAILLIAQAVVGSAVSSWMFVAAVPLYLFIGLKVISKNGIIRSFFKFFMISFIYVTVLSFSVILAVLMSLADFKFGEFISLFLI